MLILLGNPAVWWGALLGTLIAAVLLLARRSRLRSNAYGFFFLGGAVLLNFLPFAAIRRVMYLYHYLFALTLLVALAAFSFGMLADGMRDDSLLRHFGDRRLAVVYAVFVAMILAGFLLFSPFTFGFTLSPAAWDARMWVLHPRF
jgi:dolichyl-phosphate-mannose--protein O-mannosyl transferase